MTADYLGPLEPFLPPEALTPPFVEGALDEVRVDETLGDELTPRLDVRLLGTLALVGHPDPEDDDARELVEDRDLVEVREPEEAPAAVAVDDVREL